MGSTFRALAFLSAFVSCGVQAGTVISGLPALSSPHLSGDTTTGMYSAGAGLIDFAVGGSQVLELSSAGANVIGTISQNSVPVTVPGICTIASASTVDLGTCQPGTVVTVSGSTPITSFGSTAKVGSVYVVAFSSAGITITYNSTSLVLPNLVSQVYGAGGNAASLLCYVTTTPGNWTCSSLLNGGVWTTGASLTVGSSLNTGRLIVSSSTLGTNSVYLPAANSLGFSTNSIAAGRVDASQRLLWGYTADQGGGELLQVNSGAFINGKATATSVLDSGLAASAPVVSTDASKNLTTTAPTQTANTVYAGPTTGSAASPAFRALVSADMPSGFIPILSGTSGSIGGGALLAGACSSGTATVTGATTSMVALVDPTTYPGDGAYWDGYVSAANTVTVKICATIALTPSASTYNVRVLQ